MLRVRYHRHGGPEVLRAEEAEVPAPGPGGLLVRVEAVGVPLPAVRKVRGEGGGGALPGDVGGEVVGRVVEAGAGVQEAGFAVGDQVAAPFALTGSYAEYTVVPAALAGAVPKGVDAVQAAALVRGGQVASAALDAVGATGAVGTTGDGPDRRTPESVLITGAASGVGSLAVQLARVRGVRRVVAAVGSSAKAGFVRGLGADEAVVYPSGASFGGAGGERADEWEAPVDAVLDGVGGDLIPWALHALAPGGTMVAFGSGGGTVPAFDLLAGGKTVTGMSMGRKAQADPEWYAANGRLLWELVGEGRIRAEVYERIPLREAARAHATIEARANMGKVVLVPG